MGTNKTLRQRPTRCGRRCRTHSERRCCRALEGLARLCIVGRPATQQRCCTKPFLGRQQTRRTDIYASWVREARSRSRTRWARSVRRARPSEQIFHGLDAQAKESQGCSLIPPRTGSILLLSDLDFFGLRLIDERHQRYDETGTVDRSGVASAVSVEVVFKLIPRFSTYQSRKAWLNPDVFCSLPAKLRHLPKRLHSPLLLGRSRSNCRQRMISRLES